MLRRSLTTALVLGLLAVMVLLTAGNSTAKVADWRWNRCRFQSVEKQQWSEREIHLTIHCAVNKFPTSHSTADYVAQRESGMNHDSVNAYSGACGVYQHIPRYWPGRQGAFERAHPAWRIREGCFNARSNVLVSIWMAHNNGWSPWGM